MALEGEQGVVAQHAAAVVGDADEPAAAGFDFDADAGGAGVERVLEELLDDGRGALDHFAGGDLVGDQVGEDADAAHGSIVRVRNDEFRLRWCNGWMPLYAYVVVVAGVCLWLLPFVRTGWNRSAPQSVDRRSRWGLVLELAGFALMLASRFWLVSPGPWRVLASAACFGLAILLSWTATRALGRQHLRFDAAIGTEHELVRHGPYRLVRHPIYTSMLCVLWGVGFMAASPFLFAAATAVYLVGTEIRVRIEDRLLEARFGEQFRKCPGLRRGLIFHCCVSRRETAGKRVAS